MEPAPPPRHSINWLILTGVLGAAVLALAIWVIVLQLEGEDGDEGDDPSAAQIEQLEEENGALSEENAALR